ncbi:hypothetical protein PYH37_000589 [Sinorhizobium numidicum]|uniref:CopG family transcriptional regulator n=1 Tax=Sinorhizobium numidicum TaxID=680248 RepID=A0ABY8CV44_9HYPH|nr:hypothetical protein [Sinorhizobium numidicum]WEX75211.1 hypothetical protein PYH37_000589 [Sinorhizobium numidicum]WEX81205.1 hypothetical protein PYH38_000591 [Sinorhizobium numidicum]
MTYLEDDAERGIQLFMAEHAISREEALRRIVRDWLIRHGYLAPNDSGLEETAKPEIDGTGLA